MEIALENNAEDVSINDDGSVDVTVAPENFSSLKEAFDAKNIESVYADIAMDASTHVELDLETAQKLQRLTDMLEELDDVQNVFSNEEISDEVMEQLG